MVSANLKILLVCDLDNWILGEIASQLSKFLSLHFQIRVLVSQSDDFRKILRKVQSHYDVIHFLSPWDFFYFSNQITIPCVVTLWHMVNWQIFDRHVSRIDTLCVGSEQWEIVARNHVPASLPLKKMPYGLDTNRFSRTKNFRQVFISQHQLAEDVLIFGFAGKGSSNEGNRKGLDRLWECLTLLKETLHKPFIIRFMGKQWSEEIVPENLRVNTHFDFDKSPQEVPEFYSSLDYYVCTSRQEGVPYPVLEAMSCECVVLSTEVGIVPEIFDDGVNGFLLRESHLTQDFIKVITRTANDAKLRTSIGLRARETILASREWDTVLNVKEIENIYDAAIHYFHQRRKGQKQIYSIIAYYSIIRKISEEIVVEFAHLIRKLTKFIKGQIY
jgi:glycosyltransferase involved in cell wall biosynthesis